MGGSRFNRSVCRLNLLYVGQWLASYAHDPDVISGLLPIVVPFIPGWDLGPAKSVIGDTGAKKMAMAVPGRPAAVKVAWDVQAPAYRAVMPATKAVFRSGCRRLGA